MKKLMKSLMLFAAAAMALTSCENEAMNEGIESNNTVTMAITANDISRTFATVDGNKVNFSWNDEGEVLRVIEQSNSKETKETEKYTLNDGVAEFTVSFSEKEGSAFTYYAIYPSANYVDSDNNNYERFKVELLDEQNYTADSYDANADLMIAKPIATTKQPTALLMQFTRLVSVAKMTLKGMPEDKNITSLTFTAAGKALAGRAYVNLNTGEVSEYGYTGQKSEAITLNIAESDAINNDAVYFTCFPFALAEGDTFEVKAVTADKYTYTKTVTLNESKSLAFTVGNMSAFTVNMSDATVVAPGKVFSLLTDVSQLHIGDEIIIANTTNKVALSTTQNNNNRGQQSVTIEDNTITAVDGVAVLTVGKDDNFYTLYDPANSGYLYAVKNSNYLRTQETNTTAGLWTISIDNGVTTIKVESLSREMRQNSGNSIFSCYASGQNPVSIFLNDINTSDPVIPTLSAAETAINLTSEESEGTVIITAENVEGNVTATLGDEYDWFLADINAEGNLEYIAEANDTEASRVATVTLSAEGVADVVITFTQSAPAAEAEKITVAQFIENANTTTYYELTGVVSNVVNTEYGNFDLTDATGTIYVYGLYSTDGSQNKYWAASGVKEGDVITVQGKYSWYENQSKHEVVNARYISHYGFTATAASTTIAAAGGETTITLASVGTLPGAIAFTKDGDATVALNDNTATVTYGENSNTEARSTTITFTCGLATQTIIITQAAKVVEPEQPGGGETKEVTATLTMKTIFNDTATNLSNGSTYTWGDFKVTFTKNNSNTSNYNAGDGGIRWYKEDILKFAHKDGYNITKIVINATSGYANTPSADTGTITVSGTTLTWSGKSTSVAITAAGGQIRFKSIDITYEVTGGNDGGETPSEPETPVEPVKLAPPTVDATASGNSINVSWDKVANASSYTVKCGDKELNVNNTITTATFEDLEYETEYTVSVVAVGDGTNYTNSNAATKTVNTEADPNAGGGEDTTKYYVKVTSAPSDWSGTYLIVYEAGKVAFNGSLSSFDAVSNTQLVTITDGQIEATDAMNAISFTIAKNGSNYSIKGASGKYIGNNSDSNALTTGASALENTISFTSADEINIKGKGGAYLRYNATSGQTRFRYFKSGTYKNQKAIQLYKLQD